MNQTDKLSRLIQRLKSLEHSTVSIQNEIDLLRAEVRAIQEQASSADFDIKEKKQPAAHVYSYTFEKEIPREDFGAFRHEPIHEEMAYKSAKPNDATNWENFIGGNLLSKLGIFILIVGLGVLVKYAIDENLINPLGRAILAYMGGVVLLGLSYYLRGSYKAYSAVLFSGSVATFYFTTYISYAILELLPMPVAFAGMLLCTVFTVYEATRYREEVIGMIGLVGAYAVPILLSSEGGNVFVFYTYLTLINLSILWLAFRQEWARTVYVSFVLTWLAVAGSWGSARSIFEWGMLGFDSLFFIAFQLALTRILLQKPTDSTALFLLVCNTLMYYTLGFQEILQLNQNTNTFLFLFTIGLSVFHALSSLWHAQHTSSKPDLVDVHAVLSVIGFVIALPIRFTGIVLIVGWLAEALLIFSLGRIRQFRLLEYLSLALLALGVFTLLSYWSAPDAWFYFPEHSGIFLWNMDFLVLSLTALICSVWLYVDKLYPSQKEYVKPPSLLDLALDRLGFWMLFLVFLLFYVGLYREFSNYAPFIVSVLSEDIFLYRQTAAYIFSGFYVASWLWLASKWLKDKRFIMYLTGMWAFAVFLLTLHVLGRGYLPEVIFMPLRVWFYVSLIFGAVSAYNASVNHLEKPLQRLLIVHAHSLVITWLSFELVDGFLLSMAADMAEQRALIQKLGLTLFWALYSLCLVAYGIAKKRKYLRLTGFGLFGLTIFKLFLHDVSYNSPLNVILALITVGALLLITAFLYQKYKDIILADDEGNL